ncbi:hypothetical protein KUH03_36135 [Sphingobacterium sp. E70]|uniref:hypothetical protein n=1 Tax=Sphingobacterium sp. E70 TaxID=2853439 RepID=UPI00211C9100|nr:hypothetical protein [Sphingobacterium sp. E70]ULT24379.1 hypothetical protein KUH03_36135 [Sphingobacterium sp. E70]
MSHSSNIKTAGHSLENTEKALIMIHGRGGNATDILSTSAYLNVGITHYLHRKPTITPGIHIHLWRLSKVMNLG